MMAAAGFTPFPPPSVGTRRWADSWRQIMCLSPRASSHINIRPSSPERPAGTGRVGTRPVCFLLLAAVSPRLFRRLFPRQTVVFVSWWKPSETSEELNETFR